MAGEHIRAGFRLKPDQFALYEPLFHILVMQGKIKEGLKALEKYAVTTGKPQEVYRFYYEKFTELGHSRIASAIYKKASEKNLELFEKTPPDPEELPRKKRGEAVWNKDIWRQWLSE